MKKLRTLLAASVLAAVLLLTATGCGSGLAIECEGEYSYELTTLGCYGRKEKRDAVFPV